MKKLDRVIFAVIAVALAVIAMNPWIAPGYVTAQSRTTDVYIREVSSATSPLNVNIATVDGKRITLPRVQGQLPGVPVIILNVSDLKK